jgi:hypothetical protein
MWFQFPQGTDRISVALQEFQPEATDADGKQFFRAPDHFAGIILDLPGFRAAQPPEGAPADLPQADPLRDGAIGQLGAQIDALKLENEALRSSVATFRAANDELRLKLHEAETELGNLKAEAEEAASSETPKSLKK